MSWAYGKDAAGREVGYSVPDKCNSPACEKEINRGLAYRCGGVTNLRDDYGCGGYFCYSHLFLNTKRDQLCPDCYKSEHAPETYTKGNQKPGSPPQENNT